MHILHIESFINIFYKQKMNRAMIILLTHTDDNNPQYGKTYSQSIVG